MALVNVVAGCPMLGITGNLMERCRTQITPTQVKPRLARRSVIPAFLRLPIMADLELGRSVILVTNSTLSKSSINSRTVPWPSLSTLIPDAGVTLTLAF